MCGDLRRRQLVRGWTNSDMETWEAEDSRIKKPQRLLTDLWVALGAGLGSSGRKRTLTLQKPKTGPRRSQVHLGQDDWIPSYKSSSLLVPHLPTEPALQSGFYIRQLFVQIKYLPSALIWFIKRSWGAVKWRCLFCTPAKFTKAYIFPQITFCPFAWVFGLLSRQYCFFKGPLFFSLTSRPVLWVVGRKRIKAWSLHWSPPLK